MICLFYAAMWCFVFWWSEKERRALNSLLIPWAAFSSRHPSSMFGFLVPVDCNGCCIFCAWPTPSTKSAEWGRCGQCWRSHWIDLVTSFQSYHIRIWGSFQHETLRRNRASTSFFSIYSHVIVVGINSSLLSCFFSITSLTTFSLKDGHLTRSPCWPLPIYVECSSRWEVYA